MKKKNLTAKPETKTETAKSEPKKTTELKENDLEKVNGGLQFEFIQTADKEISNLR